MSIVLEGEDNEPRRLEVDMLGSTSNGEIISISGPGVSIAIGLSDFIKMAEYVLTNSNITDNDPRIPFVEKVKSMHLVPGWGASWSKRLDTIPFDTTISEAEFTGIVSPPH